MTFLFQHKFIKDYTNKSDILNLVLESKAEVVETVEDLTEEDDIKEMKVMFIVKRYIIISPLPKKSKDTSGWHSISLVCPSVSLANQFSTLTFLFV